MDPGGRMQAIQRRLEDARQATTSGRYQQAVHLATEGLNLLDSLPLLSEDSLRFALLLTRGRALVLAGDYSALSDFEVVRAGSSDPVQRIQALVGIADCHSGMGNYGSAEEEYRAALQEAGPGGYDLPRIRAWIGLGTLYWKQGRIEDAIRVLRQGSAALQRTPDLFELGRSLTSLGIAYNFAGLLEEAISSFEEALKCFRTLQDDHRVAAVLNNVGELYQELRDLERALLYHEEAARVADQVGADRIAMDVTRNIGVDLLLMGQYSEAMFCLNRALSRARGIGDKDLVLQSLYSLGDAFLRQGEVERALALARELADEAAAVRSELHMARAKLLQGRAYLAQGDRGAAQRVLQDALGHAHAIPSRWLLWQLHAALGRSTEEEDVARIHFRIAADFIYQMVEPLTDPQLRSRFLAQPEVRTVLRKAEGD